MYRSAYDLKAFYTGTMGRVVRRVLQERIREFWPDVRGLRIMGCGYATPYLRTFTHDTERVFAVMPAAQGAHHWPKGHHERNLVCLAAENDLPLQTGSIDRILLIHGLEFTPAVFPMMRETARVLRPGGKILVLVPARGGLWAHAEWSPFGQGMPYSRAQLSHCLRESGFTPLRAGEALFMPPVKFSPFLKSARLIERTGRRILPMAAGVHIIEAERTSPGGVIGGTPVRAAPARAFISRPAIQGA